MLTVGATINSNIPPRSTRTIQGLPEKTNTETLPSITAIFTPPASCFGNIYEVITSTSSRWEIFPTFKQDCYPPGIKGSATFSPGICPAGFVTVQATVYQSAVNSVSSSISTGVNSLSSTIAAVTYATCCPSGFTANETGNECQKTTSEYIVFKEATSTVVETGRRPTSYTTTIYEQTHLLATSTGLVIAPLFVVQYDGKNSAVSSLLASQSGLTGQTDADGEDLDIVIGPLSTGQIAGIVVGIIVFVFFTSGIIWYRMHRSSKRGRYGSTAGTEDGEWFRSGISGSWTGSRQRTRGLSGDTTVTVDDSPPFTRRKASSANPPQGSATMEMQLVNDPGIGPSQQPTDRNSNTRDI